jgi:hypothetical protein
MCRDFIEDLKETKRKLSNLFQLAKDRGLSPMWTHYWVTDKKGQKVIGATTCVLLDENFEPFAKGTTIRGKTDIPAKVTGRYWALKRAYDEAVGVTPRAEDIIPVPKNLRPLLEGSTVFLGTRVAKGVPPVRVTLRLTPVEESRIETKRARLRRNVNTQTLSA